MIRDVPNNFQLKEKDISSCLLKAVFFPIRIVVSNWVKPTRPNISHYKSTLPLVVFAGPPVVKRCGGHLYVGLALWIQFGAYVRSIQGTVGQTTERLCWDPPMN